MTHSAHATPVASPSSHSHIGTFSDADVAAFMPEARRQYAATFTADDALPPLDFQEWAVQGIAFNLLCESRGYSPAQIVAAREQRAQQQRTLHAARALGGSRLVVD